MSLRNILTLLLSFLFISLSVESLATASPNLGEEYRKWKDASGKFEIDAKLVSVTDGKANLERRDGKLVAVPVDKLSPVDQGYIEGRMSTLGKGGDPDNPFKEVDDSDPAMGSKGAAGSDSERPDSKGKTGGDSSEGIKEWKVVWDDCVETPLDIADWNPRIPEQPSDFKVKSLALPSKGHFFESLVESTFNSVAKRAVITYHIAPPGDVARTRMVMVDLESGKVLSNAIGPGRWIAMAVHDDGQQVLVRNDTDKFEGQIGTVKLNGKTIVPIDIWTPYDAMTDAAKEKVVRFAAFINNDRLVTLSQNGKVVIWDFATRTPVRRFSYHGAAKPALTTDRKYFGFAGGDLVGFVNLEDENEAPSVKPAKGMNYWIDSCFSPSCKRFAAANMGKLMVWDVATGETLFDGNIPGMQTSGKLIFPDEDFVMINGDKLIEISTGIKLWQYQGYSKWVDGKNIMIANEDKGGKMMEVKIPHPKALETLKMAKSQSDLFVLKKGAGVDIDLSGVPQQYQGNVEQSLKKLVSTKGFRYQPGSRVVLKPTITGPTREVTSYSFFGSFAVNRYASGLKIFYNGTGLWDAGTGSNIPGMISSNSKEEAQRQIDEAGKGPYLGFFNNIALPDFLQKPATTNGNPAMQQVQTIGVSKFTANGLSD